MKRFVLLDTTPIPESGGALCLFEYGEDFVIKIQGGDGGQLMNTRMHGSEDALAEIPCRKVAGRPDSRVLIGGLGMGFTLASALRHLGKTAEVVVAELVPGEPGCGAGLTGMACCACAAVIASAARAMTVRMVRFIKGSVWP